MRFAGFKTAQAAQQASVSKPGAPLKQSIPFRAMSWLSPASFETLRKSHGSVGET
jgi:hypothetical protein